MRSEELRASAAPARAARQLLAVYEGLAARGAHLLGSLLGGAAPAQWERLPVDDAVDRADLFQWFYHCHAPEDRPDSVEHGHFHLFARRAYWEPLADAPSEAEFAKLAGRAPNAAATRHLVGIGLDAKGVPSSLFTVDSSVTGDAMLSASATLEALRSMRLDTGHRDVDRLIEAVCELSLPDARELLARRDEALRSRKAGGARGELLSEVALDLDTRIAAALSPKRSTRSPAREDPRRRAPAQARAEISAAARGR